jgi:hypothetical protein
VEFKAKPKNRAGMRIQMALVVYPLKTIEYFNPEAVRISSMTVLPIERGIHLVPKIQSPMVIRIAMRTMWPTGVRSGVNGLIMPMMSPTAAKRIIPDKRAFILYPSCPE